MLLLWKTQRINKADIHTQSHQLTQQPHLYIYCGSATGMLCAAEVCKVHTSRFVLRIKNWEGDSNIWVRSSCRMTISLTPLSHELRRKLLKAWRNTLNSQISGSLTHFRMILMCAVTALRHSWAMQTPMGKITKQ